jgi:hypothetical protein
VETLIECSVPGVELLVTVGSQAPLLYEADALRTLRYGSHLPPHFPRWVNVYDLRDFLSYVGAGVFGDDRVTDVVVDNGESFPRSHSAYWLNPSMWRALAPHWPSVQQAS